MDRDTVTDRQRRLIEELFAELPVEFEARNAEVLRIRQAITQALAGVMQESLNRYLALQPSETKEERSDLATSVNTALRKMSLAVQCPVTQLPAILVADTDSKHPEITRFRFQVTDETGKRLRPKTTSELPLPLTLIPAAERKEGRARDHNPKTPRHR